MKLGLLCLVVASMVACTSGPGLSTISQADAAEADIPDSGVDTSVSVVDAPDAAVQDATAPYQECVSTSTKPVTTGSAVAQRCLTENYCTDSLGQTYLVDLYDSCHNMNCRWGLSCSGLKVYCLPENEQSSPEYADDVCTKPIALAEVKNGTPVSNYVGIDEFASNVDAGDAGWYSCVNVFAINPTKSWSGDVMYYLSLENGTWNCNPTYLNFPGTKMYYLSYSPVNPATLFVEQ